MTRRLRVAFPAVPDPDPDPGELPLWMAGLEIGEWVEIPGSSLSLAPSYARTGTSAGSKVGGWNGWSIDTRTSTLWALANGGHGDYDGNEVNSICLEDDAPAWIENHAPSPLASRGEDSTNVGYTLDGKPISRHSYTTQQFCKKLNRAMTFGVGSAYPSGNPRRAVDGFNPDTNTWDPQNTYPSTPFSEGAGGWVVAEHANTGAIYSWNANHSVYRWIPETNAWTRVNNEFPPSTASHCCGAIDTTRERMVIFGGTNSLSNGVARYFDIETGRFAPTTLPLSGDFAEMVRNGVGDFEGRPQKGLIYHPELDRLLWRGSAAGGRVVRIDPDTWVTSEFTTTGGGSIAAAVNHVHTRWLYAPNLGGCLLGPTFLSNIWFLRTH